MLSTLKILFAAKSTVSSFKKPPREIDEKNKDLETFSGVEILLRLSQHVCYPGRAKPTGGCLFYDQPFPKRSILNGTFPKLSFSQEAIVTYNIFYIYNVFSNS